MTNMLNIHHPAQSPWTALRKSRLIELTLALLVCVHVLDGDTLRDWLWLIYGSQLISLFLLCMYTVDRWLLVLSPSFLCATYLLVNSSIGSLMYSYEIVYKGIGYLEYLQWPRLNLIATAFLLSTVALIVPFCLASNSQIRKNKPNTEVEEGMGRLRLIETYFVAGYSLLIFAVFSFIELDISFLGGSGNADIFPKTLAAITLFLAMARAKVRGRIWIYLLIILFFATFSSNSKRHAIFLLLPILLLESQNWSQPKLNLKWTLSVLCFSGLSALLIVMMSIYRGYGQYQPKTFFDSRHYIVDYLSSPQAYEYLLNNFEINYLFYHSHQAIDYVLEDPELLLYGSTFIKFLFIPIPRSFYPNKPVGIVDHYTTEHSPDFRAAGGSWASGILSEFFWNFHYLGILFLGFVFYLMNKLYISFSYSLRRGIRYSHLYGLFAYQQIMEFARGSGSDTFILYLLMGCLFFFVLFSPVLKTLQMLKRGNGSTTPATSRTNYRMAS